MMANPARRPALIEVQHVSKRFGGLTALDDVSFAVPGGHVLAVIGPNGAGKSTLINCLSGAVDMDAGRMLIEGRPIRRNFNAQLVQLGITRTFQNVRLFASLTALEHLLLARRAYERTRRYYDRTRAKESDARTVCLDLLDRVGLAPKKDNYPSELAYGERRRLEIARGLAIDPKLFLVDEPAAGSTGAEQMSLAALIGDIATSGAAVILVEHHMDLIGRVADSVTVLNFGQVIATGSFEAIKRNPVVIAAYLGTQAA